MGIPGEPHNARAIYQQRYMDSPTLPPESVGDPQGSRSFQNRKINDPSNASEQRISNEYADKRKQWLTLLPGLKHLNDLEKQVAEKNFFSKLDSHNRSK